MSKNNTTCTDKDEGTKKQATSEKQRQLTITSKLLRDGHGESSFTVLIRSHPGDTSRTEVTSRNHPRWLLQGRGDKFLLWSHLICATLCGSLGKQHRQAVSTKKMGPHLPFSRDGSAKSLEIAENWRQQGRQKQLLCSDCQLVLIQ